MSAFRSLTVWVVLLGFISAALQVFPYTGVILMFVNAMWNINLIHIYMLLGAIVIDSLVGTFPRWFIAVPVAAAAAFGVWYYGEYEKDRARIPVIEAKLQSLNAKVPVFSFDSSRYALVTEVHRHEAVILFDLPVIYTRSINRDYDYFAIEPHPVASCGQNPGAPGSFPRTFRDRIDGHGQRFCYRQSVASPSKPVVELVHKRLDASEIDDSFVGSRTEVRADGRLAGAYVGGTIGVLPLWPDPLIGCFLISNPPAWRCNAMFRKERVPIDAIPGPATSLQTRDLEVLLDLKPRNADELEVLLSD